MISFVTTVSVSILEKPTQLTLLQIPAGSTAARTRHTAVPATRLPCTVRTAVGFHKPGSTAPTGYSRP